MCRRILVDCLKTSLFLVLHILSSSFKTIDRELVEILCICFTAESPECRPSVWYFTKYFITNFVEHKAIISSNISVTYFKTFHQISWKDFSSKKPFMKYPNLFCSKTWMFCNCLRSESLHNLFISIFMQSFSIIHKLDVIQIYMKYQFQTIS